MVRTSFRHHVLFALFALLGIVIAPSFASANEEKGIIAIGNGEVRVRPDSVRITIGVEAQAKTVEDVQKQANEKMTRVLASLRALEIPNLQLRTSILTVHPVYAETPAGVRTAQIVGYRAMNAVSVAVRKAPFDKIAGHASAILNAALRAGANVTGDFELFLDDPSDAREKALEKAVNDARRGAEIMAKAAGVTITGVALVSEGASIVPVMLKQAPQYAAPSEGTPVEAGEIVVSASVTLKLTIR